MHGTINIKFHYVCSSVCLSAMYQFVSEGMDFCEIYIGDFALKFIEKNFTYLINTRSREHSNWRFVYNRKRYKHYTWRPQHALCSCDRASWVKREERKPTRCNNIDDLLSIVNVDYWHCLNMFRATLCPSSGERPRVTACGVYLLSTVYRLRVKLYQAIRIAEEV